MIYQVYPRSFGDANGDGVGDLPGIGGHLDYLEWLGVDALWLSPIYPSPMADFGYDVADYTDVNPLFGTLADLDRLIADLHARGMRLLLDLVPNHTSNQHPWFLDARSSRSADHRDWYYWRDPAPDGGPPNEWQGVFGGDAWTLDERTGQYYFHQFLAEQPDLNWTNPAVRAAIHEVMRFWFRRGVDGFRIDVLWLLAKRRELLPLEAGAARKPPVPPQIGRDEPEIHDIVRDLRQVADEFSDRVLVGELFQVLPRLMRYYGENGGGVQLPFNFRLLMVPWQAARVHTEIKRYMTAIPAHGWPNWVLSNHDNRRAATRVGGAAQARVAQMLLLTLHGTPTMYYGDELGMADAEIPREAMRDPQGINGGLNRDVARTPMRWDGTDHGGFSTGTPWLPMGPDVATVNVAAERDDPGSMLSLVHRLLVLRRAEPALAVGSYHDLGREGSVIAYERSDGTRRFLIALNLSSRAGSLPSSAAGLSGQIVLATDPARDNSPFNGQAPLPANQGQVVLLVG